MTTGDNQDRSTRKKRIIDLNQGIYPVYEVFYLESIAETSRRALNAFNRYYNLLEKKAEPEAIATAIQEALIHSAALSRFFWPVHNKPLYIARGNKLKQHLHINDDSPLRINYLRNAIEHYDERLDEFLLDDHVGFFQARSIVSPVSIADESTAKVFRLVDPDTETFILLGERYNFSGVAQIVENIFKETTRMIGYGGRLSLGT